jgi:hypothetical protein
VEIRSYRRVFALERRIYRIDRLRLNPSGLPVRGVVYFLALLAAAACLAHLPLFGIATGMLPWYLRYLALPGASATLLTVISIDGRPFHVAACALLRHLTGPRVRARAAGPGWASRPRVESGTVADFVPRQRWHPEPIAMLPDGGEARIRRLRYTGPGAVLVAVEHERAGRVNEQGTVGLGRRGRRSRLILRELPGGRTLSQGTVIALAPGARLLVKPERKHGRMTEDARKTAAPPGENSAGQRRLQ